MKPFFQNLYTTFVERKILHKMHCINSGHEGLQEPFFPVLWALSDQALPNLNGQKMMEIQAKQ